MEMGRAQAGDRIHDEQRVVAGAAHELRNALYILPGASRTLRRLHEYRSHIGSEFRANIVQGECFTVWHEQNIHITAQDLRQPHPALTELTRRSYQNAIPGHV